MAQRIAAALAMIVFAVCLLAGINAGNLFVTVIGRAMLAMVVTLVIGLIVGAMAQKMLDENLRAQQEKFKNDSTNPSEGDR
jgi:O-antigen ligase